MNRSPEMVDVHAIPPRGVVGPPADVWAFGCLLFTYAFQRHPFGDSNLGIVNGRFYYPPTSPYSSRLPELIDRTLQQDPRQRPAAAPSSDDDGSATPLIPLITQAIADLTAAHLTHVPPAAPAGGTRGGARAPAAGTACNGAYADTADWAAFDSLAAAAGSGAAVAPAVDLFAADNVQLSAGPSSSLVDLLGADADLLGADADLIGANRGAEGAEAPTTGGWAADFANFGPPQSAAPEPDGLDALASLGVSAPAPPPMSPHTPADFASPFPHPVASGAASAMDSSPAGELLGGLFDPSPPAAAATALVAPMGADARLGADPSPMGADNRLGADASPMSSPVDSDLLGLSAGPNSPGAGPAWSGVEAAAADDWLMGSGGSPHGAAGGGGEAAAAAPMPPPPPAPPTPPTSGSSDLLDLMGGMGAVDSHRSDLDDLMGGMGAVAALPPPAPRAGPSGVSSLFEIGSAGPAAATPHSPDLATPSPSAATASPLRPGQAVCIQGLKAKPELNAKMASVLSYDEAKGRYNVMVEGGGTVLALKRANLV